MTWLSIVFWVIMHAPEILDLIRRIIHGGAPHAVKAALVAAIKSGNKQAVIDVAQKCDPSVIGCPPDVKT